MTVKKLTAERLNRLDVNTRGGTPGNSWWGVPHPVLQILTLFQTKTCNFPHPFSDQTSNIHTRFRPGLLKEIMLSLLGLESKQKNSSNPFQIRISFFFLTRLDLKR